MPELPEVETVARGVNARVRGERIAEVWFGEKPEPLKSPAMAMERALTGARILGVRRVGKTIVVDLVDGGDGDKRKPKAKYKTKADSSAAEPLRLAGRNDKAGPDVGKIRNQWLVHLGMTGRLLVNSPDVPRAKHTHAVLTLESGEELRFVDPRRFGRLSLAEMGTAKPADDSAKSGGKRKANRGGDDPAAVDIAGPGLSR